MWSLQVYPPAPRPNETRSRIEEGLAQAASWSLERHLSERIL